MTDYSLPNPAPGLSLADLAQGPVSLQLQDGLATLSLSHVPRRNALGTNNIPPLLAALAHLAALPALRVLLIRADGPMFCPGADLDWLRPHEPEAPQRIDELLTTLNPLLARLRELPMVVVAAVHGAVAGGGLGLMNCADLVLAARGTRFSVAYSRIGGTPDLGASFHLPRLLGERKAMELALLSDTIDADEAQRLGLVNFVVPQDQLAAETTKLVQRLLAGPPQAHVAIKRLVYTAHHNGLPQQLDAERVALVAAAHGAEFGEGVKAFLDKRTPRFQAADPADREGGP